MFDTETWTEAHLTARTEWSDGLFSFTLDVSSDFKAGQFARLGLPLDDDDEPSWRSYSLSSAPGAPLSFFIVRVQDGELTPHLARLRPGDSIWVHKKIAGMFTLEKVGDGRTLWLISTGTGLAPYISMLEQGALWDRFDHVVLAHGVRYDRQLAYHDRIIEIAQTRPLTYLRSTTREPSDRAMFGRLTTLFQSGQLEAAAGRVMGDDSQVMLCGNPDMIRAFRELLEDRGITLHTRRKPEGRLHLERYW